MKLLSTIGTIQKARFACKVNSMEEIKKHWSQDENNVEDYKIVELAIMNNEEFQDFKNDLLGNHDFLEGKGGTDSTTMPEGIENKRSWELTKEEINEFRRGAFRECIGVTTQQANEMIVVDPQGYNYARYSTIV